MKDDGRRGVVIADGQSGDVLKRDVFRVLLEDGSERELRLSVARGILVASGRTPAAPPEDEAPGHRLHPIGWDWMKHVRPAYSGQRSPCGCWWSATTGTDHVGERCERRSSRWEGS